MANINDVTLATLRTTEISANSVKINGKSLDEYIAEKSTGTKIYVEPVVTEGTVLAKISCDGNEKKIVSPLSVTVSEYGTDINGMISFGKDDDYTWTSIDSDLLYIEKDVNALQGTIYSKNVESENIKSYNEKYDTTTMGQIRHTISSDGSTINKEIIKDSPGSVVDYKHYSYELPNKNTVLGSEEYTAVEVFVTDKVISAGMIDSADKTDVSSVANLFDFDNTTATGLRYSTDVPASTLKVSFDGYLRGNTEDCYTTIIDWGDGSEKQTYVECANASGYPEHTYEKAGKYIIKVYGPIAAFKIKGTNCISRIWDKDLPMASTLWNMADMCSKALKLLKVQVPDYNFKWTSLSLKLYHTFYYCTNLISFSMGKGPMPRISTMNNIFKGCSNVTSIIWDPEGSGKFPITSTGNYEAMYDGCSKLSTPLWQLLPMYKIDDKVTTTFQVIREGGWGVDAPYIPRMFADCSSIPAMGEGDMQQSTRFTESAAVGRLLWTNSRGYRYNEESATWQYTNGVFSGCSDALRSQIPTTWGGSKEN